MFPLAETCTPDMNDNLVPSATPMPYELWLKPLAAMARPLLTLKYHPYSTSVKFTVPSVNVLSPLEIEVVIDPLAVLGVVGTFTLTLAVPIPLYPSSGWMVWLPFSVISTVFESYTVGGVYVPRILRPALSCACTPNRRALVLTVSPSQVDQCSIPIDDFIYIGRNNRRWFS